jgi:hypothetical protein
MADGNIVFPNIKSLSLSLTDTNIINNANNTVTTI